MQECKYFREECKYFRKMHLKILKLILFNLLRSELVFWCGFNVFW